jgi:hypothetical protein
MVPDPNNEFGNTFTHFQVNSIMPATLAHEFEHMISFGYRFITLGNGTNFSLTQVTWLEEGMAHIAEDLNNFTSSNQTRVNRYLDDPGNVSLMGSDTLEQRGGIFLFLRYLGDQLSNDVFKSMLQRASKGRRCVESVTGEDFFTTVADYLAALHLSGEGITTNPKYEFTSIVDLSSLLNAIVSRDVKDGPFGGTVKNAAGDFFEMSGTQDPATTFKVNRSANGAIRIVVIRWN